MPELRIRIDKYLPGGGADMGAVAEISRLDDAKWFRDDLSMVMVPAGEDVAPARVDLPKGVYGVQLRLPSGRFVNKRVELRTDANVDLIVKADRSRNETLSWQSYVGNVPTEREMQKRESARASQQEANKIRVVVKNRSKRAERDDLKRLRGIGPATERILADRGINTFERIADLGGPALDWVNAAVPGLRKRLSNFNWAEQARDLLALEDDHSLEQIIDYITVTADPVVPADLPPEQATDAYLFSRFEDGVTPNTIYDALHAFVHDSPMYGAFALATEVADHVAVQLSNVALVTVGPSTTSFEINIAPTRHRDRIDRFDGLERTYAAVSDAGCDWLVVLPYPWFSTRKQEPVTVDLSSDINDPSRPRVSVLPRDEQLGPLIGFISGGNSRASHAIAKSAMDSLFDKVTNPYAAALGGVVLVSAMLSGEDRSRLETWHTWVSNLSEWYPWMADAHVLRAWLILLTKSQDPSEARALFLRAAQCGLPIYGQSLRMLVDGLRWFRSMDEDDSDVSAALDRIDLAALRLDTRAVFTTLRLSNWPQKVVPL